ncbi:enolase [Nematocida sp. AWRm80]|nr:enolase [Nematocida sp. AWRm80]
MNYISRIVGRSIFDSRGNPTTEVEMKIDNTNTCYITSSCPSGASTGSQEALELRDGEGVCRGKGVLKALKGIDKIATELLKTDIAITNQKKIDEFMIKLDGTKNKSNLGANAILPLSVGFVKAAAKYKSLCTWQYITNLYNEEDKDSQEQKKNINELPLQEEDKKDKQEEDKQEEEKKVDQKEKDKQEEKIVPKIPKIFFNVINGGAHSDNGLFVQEIMVAFPSESIYDQLCKASTFISFLKERVKEKYQNTGVGDEGGFAPSLNTLEEALDLILETAEISKINPEIALDAAATEFYKEGKYNTSWKHQKAQGEKEDTNSSSLKSHKESTDLLTSDELIEYYLKIIEKYKIVMIEDPFDEKDYSAWKKFMPRALALGVHVVGDDLIVTNPELIKEAGKEKWCNVALIKMNQIGTITETIEAVKEARRHGMRIMVSHRSGETEDTFLAHLAVGLSSDYLKAGSLCRTERVCKYNELLRIAMDLDSKNKE